MTYQTIDGGVNMLIKICLPQKHLCFVQAFNIVQTDPLHLKLVVVYNTDQKPPPPENMPDITRGMVNSLIQNVPGNGIWLNESVTHRFSGMKIQ